MDLLLAEYQTFNDYLKDVEPGLSSQSFTRRAVAKTKWAIKEINQKVERLRKAVLTPMMFITPLFTVEILKEVRGLKELYSTRPNAGENMEVALRDNTALHLNVDSSLHQLHESIKSIDTRDWARQHAMGAVEKNVKSIASAVESNSKMIEQARSSMEDAVSREVSNLRRELNLLTVSDLNKVVESRLISFETQIDNLIAAKQQQSRRQGKDVDNDDSDKELAIMKTRISKSRGDLRTASQAGLESLHHLNTLLLKYESKYDSKVLKWLSNVIGKALHLGQASSETKELRKSTKVAWRSSVRCVKGNLQSDTVRFQVRKPYSLTEKDPEVTVAELPSPASPEVPHQLQSSLEPAALGWATPPAPTRPAPKASPQPLLIETAPVLPETFQPPSERRQGRTPPPIPPKKPSISARIAELP